MLKNNWTSILEKYKSKLGLSSVDFVKSHTSAIKRMRRFRISREKENSLYFSDRKGLYLAISDPVAGNHNNLFNIEMQFEVVTGILEQANIQVEGLILNADADFDSKEFRLCCDNKEINANICFNKRNGNTDRDEYLEQAPCNERDIIERKNAWIGSFRSSLNIFDTTVASWLGFNYLEFIVVAQNKINTI